MTEQLLINLGQKEPDSIEFTDEGLGAWSMSKLKTLSQCPLKFYLQYVVKIKGPPPPVSIITEVGKAAHAILENIVIGKTLTDSYALVRRSYEKTLTDDQWTQHVMSLEMSIIDFRKKLDDFEKNVPVKRYVQELRVGVDKEFNPAGFFDKNVFFRGIIDLGVQTESGDVIIIDHKTGAPASMGLKPFQTQLDMYKVLFHYGVEPVLGSQAGIHFIRDGQTKLDDYVDNVTIEGKLKNELHFYIQGAIDRALELGFFKHIRGSHCRWCDFDKICKAGVLTDVEKATKRYFPIKEIKST